MINLDTVRHLAKHGFPMETIMEAVDAAERDGSATLDGWTIRYDERGKMILIHPSYGGIYLGDYHTHVIFQRDISYCFGNVGFMSAKYRDLPAVLERLEQNTTDPVILCECCAYDYPRRKKQVEKLGYAVRRSNFTACDNDLSACYFLIARPA